MHKPFLSGSPGRKPNTVAASRKGHSVAGGQVGGRTTVPCIHGCTVCVCITYLYYLFQKEERKENAKEEEKEIRKGGRGQREREREQ